MVWINWVITFSRKGSWTVGDTKNDISDIQHLIYWDERVLTSKMQNSLFVKCFWLLCLYLFTSLEFTSCISISQNNEKGELIILTRKHNVTESLFNFWQPVMATTSLPSYKSEIMFSDYWSVGDHDYWQVPQKICFLTTTRGHLLVVEACGSKLLTVLQKFHACSSVQFVYLPS